MARRLAIALLAALSLVALSVPALAKQGAVTKFDSLPTDFHAGQVYSLGYLIKMDGVEPYKADRTEIIASSVDGRTNAVFPGVADSVAGHYTAQVSFPTSGTYQWKVTQGSYFAPFDLGSIEVLPAIATTSSSSTPLVIGDPVRDAIPFAAAGAALFATLVLARTQRQRRRLIRTA